MEPFAAPVTPGIERANRLMAIKAMPGYVEIMRISVGLVKMATDQLVEFPGWDEKQIAVLKARAQAATEHHKLLFSSVDDAIRDGVTEASEKKDLHSNESKAILNESDRVRAEVLAHTPEEDMRVAGSY